MTAVFWEFVECRFWGPSQETLTHLRQGLGKVVLFLRNVDIASHLIILSPHLLGYPLYFISASPDKMSSFKSVQFKLALVNRATRFQHRSSINTGDCTISAAPLWCLPTLTQTHRTHPPTLHTKAKDRFLGCESMLSFPCSLPNPPLCAHSHSASLAHSPPPL